MADSTVESDVHKLILESNNETAEDYVGA